MSDVVEYGDDAIYKYILQIALFQEGLNFVNPTNQFLLITN